jgi:hypothetical protein
MFCFSEQIKSDHLCKLRSRGAGIGDGSSGSDGSEEAALTPTLEAKIYAVEKLLAEATLDAAWLEELLIKKGLDPPRE